MNIPIYWKNIRRGTFDTDTLVYFREVGPQHFCYTMGAWGIQDVIVEDLSRKGCQVVHLIYTDDDGEVSDLYTDFSNYIINGTPREFNGQDGMQTFVHKRYYEQVRRNQVTPLTLDNFQ